VLGAPLLLGAPPLLVAPPLLGALPADAPPADEPADALLPALPPLTPEFCPALPLGVAPEPAEPPDKPSLEQPPSTTGSKTKSGNVDVVSLRRIGSLSLLGYMYAN
jgi:hypothetical protein